MPIRIRVALVDVTGHVDIICPDELETRIRGAHPPPLHLVAWAVIEATEPSVHENIVAASASEVGTPPFSYLVHMTCVADLPVGTVHVGHSVYHIPGVRRVAVTLLGHRGAIGR